MNMIGRVFLMASVCVLFAVVGMGQQVEASYEVSLQLLIGSNDASVKGEVPKGLDAVTRHLKTNFQLSNFRLADTLMGRVSNTGNFEYKSVADGLGQVKEARVQTFLEWSMGNFRSVPMAKGPGFQAMSFRFGARVPVATTSRPEANGRTETIYNYENIGLTFHKLGVPENVPTLVGTLNLPNADGTVFLVMTVRAVDL